MAEIDKTKSLVGQRLDWAQKYGSRRSGEFEVTRLAYQTRSSWRTNVMEAYVVAYGRRIKKDGTPGEVKEDRVIELEDVPLADLNALLTSETERAKTRIRELNEAIDLLTVAAVKATGEA